MQEDFQDTLTLDPKPYEPYVNPKLKTGPSQEWGRSLVGCRNKAVRAPRLACRKGQPQVWGLGFRV